MGSIRAQTHALRPSRRATAAALRLGSHALSETNLLCCGSRARLAHEPARRSAIGGPPRLSRGSLPHRSLVAVGPCPAPTCAFRFQPRRDSYDRPRIGWAELELYRP